MSAEMTDAATRAMKGWRVEPCPSCDDHEPGRYSLWIGNVRVTHRISLEEGRALLDSVATCVAEAVRAALDDVQVKVQEFADAYPESVFRDFKASDENVSRDRVGAAMGRHVAKVLLADIAAIRARS